MRGDGSSEVRTVPRWPLLRQRAKADRYLSVSECRAAVLCALPRVHFTSCRFCAFYEPLIMKACVHQTLPKICREASLRTSFHDLL